MKCPICGKEYRDQLGLSAKRRLTAHISAVHGKRKYQECQEKLEKEAEKHG